MFARFRPNRVDEATRRAHRETLLFPADFICPLFCLAGSGRVEPVRSMPGVQRMSEEGVLALLDELTPRGLTAVLLFGVPDAKGIEQAWDPRGIVQQLIPSIRQRHPALQVITDVCLCSFTPDGHCHAGDNDATGEILGRIAVSHARAGADLVAPSAMIDGQVHFIRTALDRAHLPDTRIMSYAAKFASHYYGPFRDAADCAPRTGDRRGYQMDPANGAEALEEIAADIEQGADQIIVKPALAYLDVVSAAARRFDTPLAAYNVSGEFAMLQNAVDTGLAAPGIVAESLTAIKRAGARRIISYFTPSLLRNHTGGQDVALF